MKKTLDTSLYAEIRTIIEQARSTAYRAVNFTMVLSYWEIGKRIVEKEQQGKSRSAYGTALLNELSSRLTAEFGKGYSEINLKYFRQFYLTFQTSGIVTRRVANLRPVEKATHCVTN